MPQTLTPVEDSMQGVEKLHPPARLETRRVCRLSFWRYAECAHKGRRGSGVYFSCLEGQSALLSTLRKKYLPAGKTSVIRAVRLLFSTFVLGASAQASVIYDFSGTLSSFGIAESFRYTAPDLITADTFVPASAFDRCSTGQTQTCLGANFLGSGPDTAQRYPELTFQSRNPDNSVGTVFYYFPLGSSFATYGTLSTVLVNPGSLTVSAVPEPATELTVLIGALILVLRVRNHRTRMPRF